METINDKSIADWINKLEITFPSECKIKVDLDASNKQVNVIQANKSHIHIEIDADRQAIIPLYKASNPESEIYEANRVVAIYRKTHNTDIKPEVISRRIKITISNGTKKFSCEFTTDIAFIPKLSIKSFKTVINGRSASISIPTSTATTLVEIIKFFFATKNILLNGSLKDTWTHNNTPSTPCFSSEVPYQNKGDKQALIKFYKYSMNIKVIQQVDYNRKYLVDYLNSFNLNLNHSRYQGLSISNLLLVTILRSMHSNNGNDINPVKIYKENIIFNPNNGTYSKIYNSNAELPSEETIYFLHMVSINKIKKEEFQLPLYGRVLLGILIENLKNIIALRRQINTAGFKELESCGAKIFDARLPHETPSPVSSDSEGAISAKGDVSKTPKTPKTIFSGYAGGSSTEETKVLN